MIGPITLGMKRTGKPGAGEPHAGFDVAGAGDVTMGAGLRPGAKAEDEPPDPAVRAPAPHPNGEGVGDVPMKAAHAVKRTLPEVTRPAPTRPFGWAARSR